MFKKKKNKKEKFLISCYCPILGFALAFLVLFAVVLYRKMDPVSTSPGQDFAPGYSDGWRMLLANVLAMMQERDYQNTSVCARGRYKYPCVVAHDPNLRSTYCADRGAADAGGAPAGGGPAVVFCFCIPETNGRAALRKVDVDFFALFKETPEFLREMLPALDNPSTSALRPYHILIIADSTSFEAARMLKTSVHKFQVLEKRDIAIPIMRHRLVPKYTVLDQDFILDLEKIYGNLEQRLPKMVANTDAVAKYLGLRKGQVVRIEESCRSSGSSVSYRIVIDAEEET